MASLATMARSVYQGGNPQKEPIIGLWSEVDSQIAALDTAVDLAQSMAGDSIKWTTNTIRVRSTANVNIANALENGDTLNGIVLATGNFVFLGSQSTPSQNGIYIVPASGAASRATFADAADELAHIGFVIQAGTVGAGERWTLPMDKADITVGSTALNFAQTGIEPSFAAELVAARDGETDLDARFDRTDAAWYTADRFLESVAGNAPTPRSIGSTTNYGEITTLTGASVSRMEAIYAWMLGSAAFLDMAYPLNFNAVTALAASTTQYYGPGQASTTLGRAIFVCNRPGVVRKLYAAVDVAPGSGKNIVLTLMVNGVASALTCTISGTGKVASDIVHDVTVAAGDLLELRAVSDSGSTTNNALSATASLGV